MHRTCFIFDLDGTLVDSERLGHEALKNLVPEVHDSIDGLLEYYRGVKLDKIFEDIEVRYKISLPDDFEAIFRAHCATIFEQKLTTFPGVHDMLAAVQSPRCIASSGPLFKIKNSLRITGIASFFGTNLFSAYDIQSWKPAPDLYLHAASTMGYVPAECIVIEDSEVGIAAADAAKMKGVCFNPEKLNIEIPEGYKDINSMDNLVNVINSFS